MGRPAARVGDPTSHGIALGPGPGSPDVLIGGHIPYEGGFALPSPRHVIVDSQGSPAAYCLVPKRPCMSR